MTFVHLLAAVFFTPAQAQQAPFTIARAVEQALRNNPSVLSARESMTQARAELSLATSQALPSLEAVATANRQKAAAFSSSALFGARPYNFYQTELLFTQPIFDSAIWAGYRLGKKNVKLKEYELQKVERALTLAVLENFYTVLLNQRLLQILQDTYKLSRDTLAISERYFKIGRAQKLDVLQLRTQVALLFPRIQQTEEKMRTAAAQLATQLRSLQSQEIRLRGELASPSSEWVRETVSRQRLDLPEILQSRLAVDQFADFRDVQMAGFWPKLSLVAEIGRAAYTKVDLVNQNTTAWSVGVRLSIPLFRGLSSIHQRQSLVAQERQKEFEETRTTDAVAVSQIETEKNFGVALAQLESSREAAQYGRESLKEAERLFRLQTINYLQYQSSQQAFLDAETNFYQAKYQYIISLARYFQAMGVPLSALVDKLQEM